MKAVALLLAVLCCVATAQAAEQEVVVTPEASDELLANPGVGWETFYCTRKQDKNLPAWIPSTVHYVRWSWRQLEPQPEKLDTAFLDKALKESHDAGQTLAFRVMCCSTYLGQPYHPAWLRQLGGRELRCDHNGDGPFFVPDLDDPIVLQRHLDFIARLGKQYDGHPDIEHVDLGSIGWWASGT